jgi:hypothetical protein
MGIGAAVATVLLGGLGILKALRNNTPAENQSLQGPSEKSQPTEKQTSIHAPLSPERKQRIKNLSDQYAEIILNNTLPSEVRLTALTALHTGLATDLRGPLALLELALKKQKREEALSRGDIPPREPSLLDKAERLVAQQILSKMIEENFSSPPPKNDDAEGFFDF